VPSPARLGRSDSARVRAWPGLAHTPSGRPLIGRRHTAWDDSGMGRRASALGIAAVGLAVGAFSLDVARDDPSYWFAGASTFAGVAFLAAG
jgi:hypothetical protein